MSRMAQTIRIGIQDRYFSARTTLMATNRDGLMGPTVLFMMLMFNYQNYRLQRFHVESGRLLDQL